jgi:transmembrane sensor
MSRAERANAEAADWLIAQEDGPLAPEEQARFDAWLAASEGNKAAYWRLEYGWKEADRVGALGPASVEPAEETGDRPRPRWWIPTAIAASIALAFVVQPFVTGPPRSSRPQPAPIRIASASASASYATPVGGKRLVGLTDGSRIQLNTQSRIRTEITAARREVWLDEGEAFFEVAHRAGQPFIVHAGDRQVTVLGTKFSVRRDGGKVVVSVLEGRVQVDELRGTVPMRSSIIVGGDIALAEGAATLVTTRSEEKVESALSWRDGVLTFDQKPLPEIAAEFNRYNVRKLVVDGRSVAAIRISGTFPAGRPDAFARLLRDAYGLEIDTSDREIRVSK